MTLDQQITASIAIAKVTGDTRQLLTQSRLAASRSCQRFHHYRYDLGVRAIQEQQTLFFGSLVHDALEAWWLAVGEDRLRAALASVAAAECDEFTRAMAVAMMVGYHERWKDEPYDVIAVEQEFCTDLRNPATGALSRTWCLAGKIDVIVRDRRDGLMRNVEHKTSSEDISPGSSYWKRLRMDSQVSVYFIGGKSLGYDIAECLYDVLGKPQLRPYHATPMESRKYKKDTGELYANMRENDETPAEYQARLLGAIAETPERYFARGGVVRLEQEMTDALTDIWELGQQIRESKIAGRAPRNPAACMNYNRECEFFSVCTGEASIDDASKFIRSADIHPELNMTKEATV